LSLLTRGKTLARGGKEKNRSRRGGALAIRYVRKQNRSEKVEKAKRGEKIKGHPS